MNTKLQHREAQPTNFKHLSLVQELRADDKEEGIIEGYVAVWDTVDSYNSRFQRGCFKKTLENRTNKIKVLYNHDTEQPIGRLIEIREDDHGLFVKAQLIMGVTRAKETFDLIKGGAIDCFSFGFRTIKNTFDKGIEVITEVMLGEISPVVFEANPASKITGVRATDFNETEAARELRSRGFRLLSSLDITLDDIWWTAADAHIPALVAKAIDDFSMAYNQWTQEVIDIRSNGTRMDITKLNVLGNAFRTMLKDDDKSLEELSQSTSFTMDELRSLQSGKVIADVSKLPELNEAILVAHNEVRSKAVETLCDGLREGINPAEATRINALLQKSLPVKETKAEDVVTYFKDFRKNLEK